MASKYCFVSGSAATPTELCLASSLQDVSASNVIATGTRIETVLEGTVEEQTVVIQDSRPDLSKGLQKTSASTPDAELQQSGMFHVFIHLKIL